MADKIEIDDIRRSLEAIRDERVVHANTARRIGNAFLSLLDYATYVGEDKLSAVDDDTAHGLITFLKGIKISKLFAFDSNGNIIAHSVTSENYNEGKEQGFTIAIKDVETGKYKLNLDELTAWGLATLGQLHVKGDARTDGDSVFGGTLSSPYFVSGFVDGTGWRLKNQPVTNSAGVQENKYTMELDNLIVRGTMRVYEMVISQLLGENDNRIFTAMLEVDHYDPESGRVYLDTKNGQMYNPFREGDYIMVEQYNGMPSSDNDSYVTKHYELLVTGVGTEGTGEETLAWVTFMNFSTDMEGGTPATLIKEKDTFVRVDNVSNPDRKGIIQMMTVGTDTPYMDIIYGLKTDPENALKGRVGNLEGIVHPLFGSLSGFGEYLNNLYATGDFVLRRTGESVDTKIQMLQNQFATRFAKTTYDINEATNFLHNGQFLTVLGEDEDSEVIDGWTVDAADETVFWVDDEGLPIMVNNGVTTSGNRRVGIDNVEGRNTLRIQDCGLTQDNALVKQPGTHKEYVKPTASGDSEELAATTSEYKDVQDTLYITAIVYAKTAGTLTMGFQDCTTVEGKENDLAAKDFSLSYTGDWDKVKMEGKWNGTGSFRLAYTGDILVSLVTVTTEPLDNLSKEVSTQIIQTASNIQLLGENVDKVQGTVTTLESTVDAELGEIRTAVGQAATKKEVEENKKTLEDAMATQKTQLQTYANTAANTAATGVRNDYASTISLVNQNAGSWSYAAGRFDKSGNLTEMAGQSISTYVANMFAQKLKYDSSGNVTNISKSGLLVTADKTELETKITNVDGKVVSKATISTMITDGISSATINADKINVSADHKLSLTGGNFTVTSGNFTVDKSGNVTMTGTVNATSGKFGLWSISQDVDGNKSQGLASDKLTDITTTKYTNFGLGYAYFHGYSGTVMIAATSAPDASIRAEMNTGALYAGYFIYNRTDYNGGAALRVEGKLGSGMMISTTNASGSAINIARGFVKGLRLPCATGIYSVAAGSDGSEIVFLSNSSSDQTITLATPTIDLNGAVVIIVPLVGRSFTVKGSLKQKGSTASSVGLGGDSIAICICNGSYWNVSYAWHS